MQRRQLGRNYSEEMFSKHAIKVHPKNLGPVTGPGGPMRGGIRL